MGVLASPFSINSLTALGFKRDTAPALVLEGVHFLVYYVGGFAHSAQKQLRMLKHGRADFFYVENFSRFSCRFFYELPFTGLIRQNVLCALGYVNHKFSLI